MLFLQTMPYPSGPGSQTQQTLHSSTCYRCSTHYGLWVTYGRCWVATFIYTDCGSDVELCPVMSWCVHSDHALPDTTRPRQRLQSAGFLTIVITWLQCSVMYGSRNYWCQPKKTCADIWWRNHLVSRKCRYHEFGSVAADLAQLPVGYHMTVESRAKAGHIGAWTACPNATWRRHVATCSWFHCDSIRPANIIKLGHWMRNKVRILQDSEGKS